MQLEPLMKSRPLWGSLHPKDVGSLTGVSLTAFLFLRLGLYGGLAPPLLPKLADEMLKNTASCEQSQSHLPHAAVRAR